MGGGDEIDLRDASALARQPVYEVSRMQAWTSASLRASVVATQGPMGAPIRLRNSRFRRLGGAQLATIARSHRTRGVVNPLYELAGTPCLDVFVREYDFMLAYPRSLSGFPILHSVR